MNVLFLGDSQRSEFQRAYRQLTQDASVSTVSNFDDARSYLQQAGGSDEMTMPDRVVVAQSFRQQYSHQQLNELQRLSPISEFVGLLGSWCEGETRSGSPWPAAYRVFGHQWLGRMQCQPACHRIQYAPITASSDEQWLAEDCSENPAKCAKGRGLICIVAPNVETGSALSEALQGFGYSTAWGRTARDVSCSGSVATLVEFPACRKQRTQYLQHVQMTCGHAPIFGFLDFPRADEIRELLDLGLYEVVSRPFRLNDLVRQIENSQQKGSPQAA